ncbi:MAG: hypothetical protein ABFS56_35755, partial [Pseudomonadota bacterium]
MKHNLIFNALLLLSTISQAAIDCEKVTQIPITECQALIALYDATDGKYWVNSNGWTVINNPCNWYGIYCSDGHITTIELSSNRLTGTIPPEVGNLTHLKKFNLDNNQLNGSIPIQISDLTKLMYLWLSFNQLSGSIPDELDTLTNLKDLRLENNQLNGSIPAQLGSLEKLKYLHLDSNQLCGEIPLELMNLPIPSATNYLKLDNNH